MPSNRPNLTMDEQSFQSLLSAAFTIQEHNDHRKQVRLTQADLEACLEPEAHNVCPHCGAPKRAEGSRCQSCGLDEFRPGERLQHNWASMWLMSQEQGLWPERSPEAGEAAQPLRQGTQQEDVPPFAPKRQPRAQERTKTVHDLIRGTPGKSGLDDRTPNHPALDKAAASNWTTESAADEPIKDEATEDFPPLDFAADDSDLTLQPFQLSGSDDSSPTDAPDARTSSLLQRLADVRVTLRFHRADLYLGVAIFVAALALLWPAASAPQRAALGPWERALVTLGIAEAPAPTIHLQGDPGIKVWVDPHTALYYCDGEEQYGKTADGRFSSQREAQMDQFEPAGRSACD